MEQTLEELSKSKQFEQIVIEADPMYDDVVKAISIVKDFIRKNNFIIYGGTAIDFALRLHGDKIYPDESLSVADLDFFAPDSVNAAYNLADILLDAGFADSRAIVATYVRTMRVDIGLNHFIADISYIPPNIFAKLEYLEYDGMRIVHPTFQRADLHSSLSFPYDNPPREVIFSRWEKDIKRFNLLDKYYPITSIAANINSTISFKDKHYIFTGEVAYAILYTYFVENYGPIADVMESKLVMGENGNLTAVCRQVEIVHFNMIKAAEQYNAADITLRAPYINLLSSNLMCKIDGAEFQIFSTKGKLLSINSIKMLNGLEFRVSNVQYLLKLFIGKYMFNDDKISLYMYTSLIKMINAAESAIKDPEVAKNSPFFPSINIYGNENRSPSSEVAVRRLLKNLGEVIELKIPQNYSASKKIRSDFDYNSSEFFVEDGRKLNIE